MPENEVSATKRIIHKQLHEMEEEFIQISGLMKSLQQLLTGNENPTCVANAMEERLQYLQKQFYYHWQTISK